MEVNRHELLERFLRYTRVETAANPETDAYPSSDGQFVLGKLLVDELIAMGAADVEQDSFGLVTATLPPTTEKSVPVLAWNSHLDTSPDASGANVNPQVIDSYSGGDITLPADTSKVIRVEENPELEQLHGCTLVTTDGTTLLGGDDKAGVSIIMQTAKTLLENPGIARGKIRLLFTCDEEIGRGVNHVDLEKLGADACYTLDGPDANKIDVETFSADLATATFRGVNIHPSIGKNRMKNAIRAAAHFIGLMPADHHSPETTENREGYIHPYLMQGAVDEVTLRILLRSFDTKDLGDYASMLRDYAQQTMHACPGVEVEVNVQEQYRNLADGLRQDPRVVEFAELAHQRLGRESSREIIRGGTDGSRLTELGLPTPNLSSGQHNPHSVLEWACLDEMVQAAEVLVELAQVWSDNS